MLLLILKPGSVFAHPCTDWPRHGLSAAVHVSSPFRQHVSNTGVSRVVCSSLEGRAMGRCGNKGMREYAIKITSSFPGLSTYYAGAHSSVVHIPACAVRRWNGDGFEAALVLLHPSMHISVRSSHVVAMKSPRNHASHIFITFPYFLFFSY